MNMVKSYAANHNFYLQIFINENKSSISISKQKFGKSPSQSQLRKIQLCSPLLQVKHPSSGSFFQVEVLRDGETVTCTTQPTTLRRIEQQDKTGIGWLEWEVEEEVVRKVQENDTILLYTGRGIVRESLKLTLLHDWSEIF